MEFRKNLESKMDEKLPEDKKLKASKHIELKNEELDKMIEKMDREERRQEEEDKKNGTFVEKIEAIYINKPNSHDLNA